MTKMYRYEVKYRTKRGTVRKAIVSAPNKFAAQQAVSKKLANR